MSGVLFILRSEVFYCGFIRTGGGSLVGDVSQVRSFADKEEYDTIWNVLWMDGCVIGLHRWVPKNGPVA